MEGGDHIPHPPYIFVVYILLYVKKSCWVFDIIVIGLVVCFLWQRIVLKLQVIGFWGWFDRYG